MPSHRCRSVWKDSPVVIRVEMFVSPFFYIFIVGFSFTKLDVFFVWINLQQRITNTKKNIQFSVYIQATAGMCIISLITDAIATLLTGLGLRTKNHNVKYRFYRYAVLVMLLACKWIWFFFLRISLNFCISFRGKYRFSLIDFYFVLLFLSLQ